MITAVVLLGIASSVIAGSSSKQCSYAGTFDSKTSSCTCFPGFQGPTCAALNNQTAIPIESGFRMDDFHVWGSQVQFVGNQYVMAASIYPANLSFYGHWLSNAQIIMATSPNASGPYTPAGIALGYGSESDWDRSLMNPKFMSANGSWLIFYTGDTYSGPMPTVQSPNFPESDAQAAQQIGMAVASSPLGPYHRLGHPVLSPRPGKWDSRMVTNPTVTVLKNGSLFMIYKASNPAGGNTKQSQVCFGAAIADSVADAAKNGFRRLQDDPIIPCPANSFLGEDPTVWTNPDGDAFHLVVKDADGTWTHDGYSGAHFTSTNGFEWELTTPALTYTTSHMWSDGKLRKQHHQERAQVLLGADGYPEAMFFATDTLLDGSVAPPGNMWNMYMPLR